MRTVLFLYRLIIAILYPIAMLATYIIARRKKDTAFFSERFGIVKLKNAPYSKSVWFHAASVGEVRSLKNIVTEIRQRYPDASVIVSTFTTTGRNEAKTFLNADEYFLLPIENAPAVKHLIKLMGVRVFFIVDTEIWPALIATASELTPLFMLNARMTEKTFNKYYKFRLFFRPLIGMFSAIFTKSADDLDRFKKLLGNDTKLADIGNIKFQTRKNINEMSILPELKYKKYFFAASTHKGEEEEILEAFKKCENLFDNLVIAPRHIVRCAEVLSKAQSYGFSACLYSQFDKNAKVIIIDSFGMLEKLYAYADKIFVGGSLVNIGGHNIFEALQFGKTIAVGAFMQNFSEIYDMASTFGLLTTIKNSNELAEYCMADQATSYYFSDFFAELDKQNADTLNCILEVINPLLISAE